MDAVITYVDGLDPLWQKDYADAVGRAPLTKRFRDWGTLKYLLRGIRKYMPFVKNVYLVVSRDSQVPSWVDRSHLKIVLHEDIIPAEYLPVFNSTAIEMFLHRIDDLDEEYLYFNDDFFPLDTCRRDDFFIDGRPVIGFSKCLSAFGLFRRQTRNSDRMARNALGLRRRLQYVRPQHVASPMLRSECFTLASKVEKEISSSISRVREPQNLNQYLFLDYMYYGGKVINRRSSNKHFSLAVSSLEKITDFIRNPKRKFACINDVQMSDEKYRLYRDGILAAFEQRLPEKSEFEL